jgi:ubiquinone/menaquinone biosynthesis C-methylase UbiE
MKSHSTEFYDRFADKYDVMISDKRYDREMPFFNNVFRKYEVKSILDCSCGTGLHVIKFSQLGFEATGCDISHEMVKKAKRNAASRGINVDFVQADFKKLTDVFDKKFDYVVCLGNSLNHEFKDKGMLSALRSMYNVLRNKGVVIIQIRNLPKLIKEKKRIFPTHFHKEPNGDRKLFIYVLDFYRSKVTFNVISFLEFNEKPKFEVNSVDYRIVSAEKLKALMTEVGFKELKIYGDFEFTKFSNDNSENIIVTGKK